MNDILRLENWLAESIDCQLITYASTVYCLAIPYVRLDIMLWMNRVVVVWQTYLEASYQFTITKS